MSDSAGPSNEGSMGRKLKLNKGGNIDGQKAPDGSYQFVTVIPANDSLELRLTYHAPSLTLVMRAHVTAEDVYRVAMDPFGGLAEKIELLSEAFHIVLAQVRAGDFRVPAGYTTVVGRRGGAYELNRARPWRELLIQAGRE